MKTLLSIRPFGISYKEEADRWSRWAPKWPNARIRSALRAARDADEGLKNTTVSDERACCSIWCCGCRAEGRRRTERTERERGIRRDRPAYRRGGTPVGPLSLHLPSFRPSPPLLPPMRKPIHAWSKPFVRHRRAAETRHEPKCGSCWRRPRPPTRSTRRSSTPRRWWRATPTKCGASSSVWRSSTRPHPGPTMPCSGWFSSTMPAVTWREPRGIWSESAWTIPAAPCCHRPRTGRRAHTSIRSRRRWHAGGSLMDWRGHAATWSWRTSSVISISAAPASGRMSRSRIPARRSRGRLVTVGPAQCRLEGPTRSHRRSPTQRPAPTDSTAATAVPQPAQPPRHLAQPEPTPAPSPAGCRPPDGFGFRSRPFELPPRPKLASRLRRQGHTPVIVPDAGLYKVRIGNYATRPDAVAALPALKAKLGAGLFVVAEP